MRSKLNNKKTGNSQSNVKIRKKENEINLKRL